jgi:hypothetical protein
MSRHAGQPTRLLALSAPYYAAGLDLLRQYLSLAAIHIRVAMCGRFFYAG